MSSEVKFRAHCHFPTIVTLCGSTKFKQEFIQANFDETRAGRIVLSVGFFSHTDGETGDLPPQAKIEADILHLRKIDISDEILVINVDGYTGESTQREIAYAKSLGKPVRYLYCKEIGGERWI